jgi:DNA-binding response OmpR family regulator
MTTDDRRTILLVDDDIETLASIRATLEREGYAVACASSGQEALEWLETTVPDLIILDVVMPGLDGMEVCRRIRSHPDPHRNQVPVIFLTTRSRISDLTDGQRAGGDLYFIKPVLAGRVLRAIQLFLSGDIKRRASHPFSASAR